MTMAALAACGHFLAAFALVAALAMEWLTMRGRIDAAATERLLRIDALYGASALAVLAFGLLRVFVHEKPAAFYLDSLPFRIKLGVFALIALLSIRPTLAIFAARRQARRDAGYVMPPAQVDGLRRIIGIELILLPVLVIAASLMAKGIAHLGG